MLNNSKTHVIDHLSMVRHHRGKIGSLSRNGAVPNTISVMTNRLKLPLVARFPGLWISLAQNQRPRQNKAHRRLTGLPPHRNFVRMFHMLSSFNLIPGIAPKNFAVQYDAFVAEMKALGLVAGSSPVGLRHPESGLDTDESHQRQFFAVMHFEDRAQSERAYDWIAERNQPTDQSHRALFSLCTEMVFTAWEDV